MNPNQSEIPLGILGKVIISEINFEYGDMVFVTHLKEKKAHGNSTNLEFSTLSKKLLYLID